MLLDQADEFARIVRCHKTRGIVSDLRLRHFAANSLPATALRSLELWQGLSFRAQVSLRLNEVDGWADHSVARDILLLIRGIIQLPRANNRINGRLVVELQHRV